MSANSSTTSSRSDGRSARAYVVALFATVLILIGVSYAARFTVLASIAPRFTGNASFDQKLLFIKQQNFGAAPLSVIAGSSMALNNLDADELQKSEGIRYVNAASWSLSVAQVAKFVSLLESRFNVKELTLAVQFFDLGDDKPTKLGISDEDFHNFLSDNIWMLLTRPSDILDAVTAKYEWNTSYGNPRGYEYLGFTKTGSVLLYFTKQDIDPNRWNSKQEFPASCQHCMTALTSMCITAQQHKIPFFVVLPPLTQFIRSARPDVRKIYEDRRQKMAVAVADCGGRLFDADRHANFDDSCFVDFAHLNAEGARRMTQLFLQWKHSTLWLPQNRQKVRCN